MYKNIDINHKKDQWGIYGSSTRDSNIRKNNSDICNPDIPNPYEINGDRKI
jgi:hypothetical protein